MSAGTPSRSECIDSLRQAYAEEWREVWEQVRRHGTEHAARSAADPEKARQRLEEIRAAAGRKAAA